MKLEDRILNLIAGDALLAAEDEEFSYFGEVAKEYEPMVFELAMSLTEEPALAIDILDEVFEHLRNIRCDSHSEPLSVLLQRITFQTAMLAQLSPSCETIH